MTTGDPYQSKFKPIPTLVIPVSVWQKIMAYTGICAQEISGFGYIVRNGNDLVVSEAFILDQEVTEGTADVSEDTLARHIHEMMRADISPSRLRFQWHSHVWGATYCSHIDEANIDLLGSNTDWMVSLVVNKRGQAYAQLDVFQPYRITTAIPRRIVLPPAPQEEIDAYRIEVTEKVRGRGRWRTANSVATGNPATSIAI